MISESSVIPATYFALAAVGLGWLFIGFRRRVWPPVPFLVASALVVAPSIVVVVQEGSSLKLYPGLALVYGIVVFFCLALGRRLSQLVLQGRLK